MSLLNKFLPKEKNKEYFLAVGVEENKITATVAQITEKEVTIIGSGQSEFTDDREEVEAADIAISEAEKKIGENILVQRVIFGLPLSLLEGDKIKSKHLARLKKITKTLSLIPSGFVDYPQALAYFLETKEESPPTLLLLSIGKTQITFSHLRVGKIEKNVIVPKSSSITADFEKALSEFTSSEILPSRIILYDEGTDEKLQDLNEELLTFPWHKHSTFLHTPKIENLETSALTYALVEAAARSLAQEIQLEDKEEIKEEIPQEKKGGQVEETFGFVKGEDTNLQTEQTEPEKEEVIPEQKPVQKMPENLRDEEFSHHFSMPQFSLQKFPLISIIIGISVLAIIFFSLFYLPKAKVNLIVYPSSSSSQIDVLFTSDENTVKSEKNAVSASLVSQEITGEKSTPATGKTQIGEKAKGTVTLYNKTVTGKTFPKETVISVNDLNFTLDNEATIASASDTGEGLTFGKTTANITASEIGPQSNLSANTNFAFKDFDQSSYYGKNTDKLTGGTSRDITSVSKDDQEKLLSDLTQDLISKAKQQMMQNIKPGKKLLDSSVDYTVVSKKFSKNLDEEATELGLSLVLKINSLEYEESDLISLTQANIADIPSGFTQATDKTFIRVNDTEKNKNGDVTGKAIVTYFFFPNLETDQIKSEITGKSFSEADKYLSEIKDIGGLEIISETNFPFLKNKLPFRPENINIAVVPR